MKVLFSWKPSRGLDRVRACVEGIEVVATDDPAKLMRLIPDAEVVCVGEFNPHLPEVCNGFDDNCDGIVDGMSRVCYDGPAGTQNVGICHGGQQQCTAIMCAEAVWWRCHRRIVADYLIAAGDTVFHILAAGKIEPAKLTPAARRTPEGILVYPR